MDDIDKSILAHFSPGFGGTLVPEWLKPYLENGLGGVTLFSFNCPTFDETSRLIEELRSYNPNLIISIDEEGGDVTRLFIREGSPFPTPSMLGRCDDIELTQSSYYELGKILKNLGISMSFAPVADVIVEERNPIVGVRSFGRDVALVSRHVAAAVNGLQKAGVAACIKHFPGHGGVIEDSHHHLPSLPGSLQDLESTHLEPFFAGIEVKSAGIMVGHIITPALDEVNPASCSKKVISGYLKGNLGYNGLVVTDALDMGALGGVKKIGLSARRAITAGADLLCFSGMFEQEEFVSSSLKLIREGIIASEIDLEYLTLNASRLNEWTPPKAIGTSAPMPLSIDRIAQGFAVTGNTKLTAKNVHLIEMSAEPTIAAGYVAWGLRKSLTRAGIAVKLESSDAHFKEDETSQVVVTFRDAYRDSKLKSALEKINTNHPDAIFVDMGWPTPEFSPANIIRTYGSSALASDAAATLLTH